MTKQEIINEITKTFLENKKLWTSKSFANLMEIDGEIKYRKVHFTGYGWGDNYATTSNLKGLKKSKLLNTLNWLNQDITKIKEGKF